MGIIEQKRECSQFERDIVRELKEFQKLSKEDTMTSSPSAFTLTLPCKCGNTITLTKVPYGPFYCGQCGRELCNFYP